MATVFFSKDSRAGRERGTPFQTRRFGTVEEAQAWANEQHANEWFACRHVSAFNVKAPNAVVRLLKVIEWEQKPEINPVTVESLEQLLQVLGITQATDIATDIKKAVCKTVFGVGGYSFFVTKDGIKLVGSRNSHEFVYPFDMHELEQLAFIYDDSDLAKHLGLEPLDEEEFIYDDDDTDLAGEPLGVKEYSRLIEALRERINPRLHVKVVKSDLGIQFYVNNKQVGKTIYFAFTVGELTAALDAVNQRANVSLFQFIFTPSIKRLVTRLIQFLWRL